MAETADIIHGLHCNRILTVKLEKAYRLLPEINSQSLCIFCVAAR